MLNRTMCLSMVLLSSSLLFTVPTITKTPFLANNIKENNIDEMVHKTNFQIQYEKDKAESDRAKAKKQKQEELNRIKEEKQQEMDKICYYNPNNVTEISGISVQKAYELLSGTTYKSYEIAEQFVNAEKLNPSVNCIFLISLSKLESLHGQSNIAQSKNNITSWRVSRGSWKTFNSKAECINKTANMLSENYLNPNGAYYKDVDIWSIGKNYCEGNKWGNSVNTIANELKNRK